MPACAVATRLDKRDFIWREIVDAASIRTWLRNPSHDLKDTLQRGFAAARARHGPVADV
jgi:hypothetical protein